MAWTARMFTSLGLPTMLDANDEDLIRVKFLGDLFLIRLSLFHITPTGDVDLVGKAKVECIDNDTIPQYKNWDKVNQLHRLIARGAPDKVVWIRSSEGSVIGLKYI